MLQQPVLYFHEIYPLISRTFSQSRRYIARQQQRQFIHPDQCPDGFFVSERENLVFRQPDRTLRPRLRRLQFCQKRSTASLALFNACARSVDYLIPLQPNSLFFAKHTQHMSVSQTKKPIRFTSSSICHSGCFVFFLPFDQFSDF